MNKREGSLANFRISMYVSQIEWNYKNFKKDLYEIKRINRYGENKSIASDPINGVLQCKTLYFCTIEITNLVYFLILNFFWCCYCFCTQYSYTKHLLLLLLLSLPYLMKVKPFMLMLEVYYSFSSPYLLKLLLLFFFSQFLKYPPSHSVDVYV